MHRLNLSSIKFAVVVKKSLIRTHEQRVGEFSMRLSLKYTVTADNKKAIACLKAWRGGSIYIIYITEA